MTDTVENQSAAPAASSAPATGEPSPQAPAEQTGTPPAADAPNQAPTATAGEAEDGDSEGASRKKESRKDRQKRAMQLLAAENEELRRKLGPGARPNEDATPKPAGAAEAQPPKEADFNGDYLAYERALNAWNTEQAVIKAAERVEARNRAAREEAEKSASEAREAARFRELMLDHQDRVEELSERIPDFDETIKAAADVKLRNEVVEAILESDKSALLQYHLAKNTEKARELNGLTGRELARAIGRLEGAVRLPAAKKATEASPPVAPLNGAAAATSFDPAKAEMDDYVANFAERKKRLVARA